MFTVKPQGSYSLAQSRNFLQGFTPASGTADTDGAELVLAFLLDKTWQPAAVKLTQDDAGVHGRVYGGVDEAAAQRQALRMLAADVDGRGFDAILAKDAVLKDVAALFPGFRPVSFASPYEAAVWGILAQRISMKQAATIRKKIALEHGETVDVDGRKMQVFPAPQALLRKKRPPFVPEEKWVRLHGIAQAALDGVLDADALLAADSDASLERLKALPGVGQWTAGHILLRGTGARDFIALVEPRVVKAIEFAYGKKADAKTVSDTWRPYRTWVMVLLVLHLGRNGDWSVDRKKRR